ncbi:MAG TPA: hypothetical protein VFR36_08280 [Sphingomicrobium sp.]|nr:hypothetical protein [Sphingomicrobium sp.]
MARFVTAVVASVLAAVPVQAQHAPSKATSPWHISEQKKPERSFNLADAPKDPGTAGDKGAKIVAGTELYPNATFGVGMFGEKSERPAQLPATNRDYTVPSTRKAAVGFALKF